MNARDFEFAGEYLRDYNMIICCIDSGSSDNTVTAGSTITWEQVSTNDGKYFSTTSAKYEEPLETTFQICKFDCSTGQIEPLNFYDQRRITRWLNRKEPHLLHFIDDEDSSYDYVYFEGSFNLSKVEIGGVIYGYELNFKSNRPFAIGDPIKKELEFTTDCLTRTFEDYSDETGYVYPKTTKIECTSSSDVLIIHNSQDSDSRNTEIANCKTGDIYTFDEFHNITAYPNAADDIQDRFNFAFFRVGNTYEDNKNTITVSSPCKISFEYLPIIKGVSL